MSRIQFIHTYNHIISLENLLGAWKEFIRGKRNKKDVQEFEMNLMGNILALYDDLQNKTYAHGPYREFNISDPKPRRISKASVRDRLLHHAIHRVLYPFFDRTFIADSYSCRLGKGTHRAMNRFRSFAYKVGKNNTRTCWVLKCDIRKFFASINHEILLNILAAYIPDQNIRWLLNRIVGSFHSGIPGVGLPLGNLTSQLLVNIYMNEFDQFAKHTLKTKHYVRYADDFVFMHHDKSLLGERLPRVDDFLQERLCLELHPKKVSIQTLASGVDFLGWVHFPDHRVVRTATRRRMLKRLAKCPSDETVASYRGLLKHGNTVNLSNSLPMISGAS